MAQKRVCSTLSVVFGCIAFMSPFFGLAGLVLGIIGVVQDEQKGLGTIGIVLSVVGAIVGMAIGAVMMTM